MANTAPSQSSLRSIIFAVASGQFFLPFLMAGVMAVLPAIAVELQASAVELSLVGAVYTLSLTIFHLAAGRIGDMVGRRRLFLFGFGLFIITTALMTVVPNMTLLLGLRFVQAAGTGIMNTTALAILVTCAPPAQRGRVLAVTSVGLYLGITCGPPLAGLVTATLGWRWMFGLLVPVALPAWMLMAFSVKGEWRESPDDPFDWAGCLCFAASVVALAFGATWISSGWWAKALLGAGIGGLGLFIWCEGRAVRPLVDVAFTLRNRALSLGLLTAFINFGSVFGGLFYFSLYIQYIHGLTPGQAGLFLSIQPVVQIFVAPLAGRLADTYGPERVATLGIAVCGLSLLCAALLTATTPLWLVGMALFAGGLGMALFGSPNTSAIMGSVDSAHLGQTSGLVGTVRTFGMLSNMVLISMTMNAYLGDDMVNTTTAPLFVEAMHFNFVILGLVNLLGFACSVIRLRRPHAPHKEHP